MMSKERELLYRWYKGAQDQVDFNELYDKTEELLAQPEPEPDYYLRFDEVHEEHPTIDGDPDVYPLHTSPPKREPLSDDEIMRLGVLNCCNEANAFKPFSFARAIEKAHGISE